MATRTPKATLGMQPKAPTPDDAPAPNAVQPDAPTPPSEFPTPASAPDVTPPKQETAPEAVEEKGMDKEPEAEEPRILTIVEKELEEMISRLQSNLDSLKEQKAETPDHMSLMKLSCAKVLREATHKVLEMQGTVTKMRTLHDEIRTKQKNFDDAIAKNRHRSEAFRTERAAFIKLRSMSEKEYYVLVNELMARIKAEKEAA